ncbi:MAG: 30S ribosomal protein S10 [Candidatus Campbellbacteria bacterium]|nr:30S ribosomal protein S10 [Candidatus Campbellbacteria bacterium]
MSMQKLRIRVQAYDSRVLDTSVKQVVDTGLRLGFKVVGPVPLPTTIKKYSVNRSTFIFKSSGEQFETRVHRRLIDILNPTQQVIEALTNIDLPTGVNVSVKLIANENSS